MDRPIPDEAMLLAEATVRRLQVFESWSLTLSNTKGVWTLAVAWQHQGILGQVRGESSDFMEAARALNANLKQAFQFHLYSGGEGPIGHA